MPFTVKRKSRENFCKAAKARKSRLTKTVRCGILEAEKTETVPNGRGPNEKEDFANAKAKWENERKEDEE